MSTEEAAVMEPGGETIVVEAPETPPENNPQEDNSLPQPQETPDLPEGQPTEQEAQVQAYQDVLSKFEADSNYDMSYEEAEAFQAVQDMIMNGDMEDPGAAKPKEESEDKKPTEEKEEGKEKEGEKSSDEPDPEADLPGVSDKNHESVITAMKKVGAKDITELGPKIDGLIKHMKTSGGEMGTELKQYKTLESQHISWINDLSEGRPEAIEHLNKLTKNNFSLAKEGNKAPVKGNEDELEGDDKYLDTALASEVQELRNELKEAKDTIKSLSTSDKQRKDEFSYNEAATGWVEDITDLVNDFKNDFSISPSEARTLAKQYWSKDGYKNPIHPKFQPIYELILFANKRNFPDLKSAHIMLQHENGTHTKKIIDAKLEGAKSSQHKPSQNGFLSKHQTKAKSNVPNPNVTDDTIASIESGNFMDVPDDWVDEDGVFIRDKVPQRFHKKIFGN